MRIKQVLIVASMLAISGLALAGEPSREALNSVPEPETLALLGVGAVALLASRWRKNK